MFSGCGLLKEKVARKVVCICNNLQAGSMYILYSYIATYMQIRKLAWFL